MTNSDRSPAGGVERPTVVGPDGEKALVVIPTFNERENLPLIIGRLQTALSAIHVLVVDDSSPDGTGEVADELAAADVAGRIHVLHRVDKDGLGKAYLAGFAWGLARDYEVIIEMDADGSHAPEQLPALLAAINDGADLVIGSRYVKGGELVNWPRRREILSRGATPTRVSRSVPESTTLRPVTARTAARCWRRSASIPSNPPGTASRSTWHGDRSRRASTSVRFRSPSPNARSVSRR